MREIPRMREMPRIAKGSIASINSRLQAMWVSGSAGFYHIEIA